MGMQKINSWIGVLLLLVVAVVVGCGEKKAIPITITQVENLLVKYIDVCEKYPQSLMSESDFRSQTIGNSTRAKKLDYCIGKIDAASIQFRELLTSAISPGVSYLVIKQDVLSSLPNDPSLPKLDVTTVEENEYIAFRCESYNPEFKLLLDAPDPKRALIEAGPMMARHDIRYYEIWGCVEKIEELQLLITSVSELINNID
jgi:hypothetical protein